MRLIKNTFLIFTLYLANLYNYSLAQSKEETPFFVDAAYYDIAKFFVAAPLQSIDIIADLEAAGKIPVPSIDIIASITGVLYTGVGISEKPFNYGQGTYLNEIPNSEILFIQRRYNNRCGYLEIEDVDIELEQVPEEEYRGGGTYFYYLYLSQNFQTVELMRDFRNLPLVEKGQELTYDIMLREKENMTHLKTFELEVDRCESMIKMGGGYP